MAKRTNKLPQMLWHLVTMYAKERPWTVAAIVTVTLALLVSMAFALSCFFSDSCASKCPGQMSKPAATSPCSGGY